MQLPPHSPDLNVIEVLWGILKKGIPQKLKSMDEIRNEVERVWKAIPDSTLSSLVQSMPERIDAVIKARGMNTVF